MTDEEEQNQLGYTEWKLEGDALARLLGAAELLMSQGETSAETAACKAFEVLHGADPMRVLAALPRERILAVRKRALRSRWGLVGAERRGGALFVRLNGMPGPCAMFGIPSTEFPPDKG